MYVLPRRGRDDVVPTPVPVIVRLGRTVTVGAVDVAGREPSKPQRRRLNGGVSTSVLDCGGAERYSRSCNRN